MTVPYYVCRYCGRTVPDSHRCTPRLDLARAALIDPGVALAERLASE